MENTMKTLTRTLALLTLVTLCIPAFARGHKFGSVAVRGHITKRGTFVMPSHRSHPDKSFTNNWSTKGNINPYTGKAGTRVTRPSRRRR